jgi:membrane protein GlpM
MTLALKALLGAAAVILIQLIAQTKNYFIAGLVPLFPTFALIAHYLVGRQRSAGDLQRTILFGMASLIPYFLYLLSLYFLVGKCRLWVALVAATGVWILAALALILIWKAVAGMPS